jgi:hypothetical protein
MTPTHTLVALTFVFETTTDVPAMSNAACPDGLLTVAFPGDAVESVAEKVTLAASLAAKLRPV